VTVPMLVSVVGSIVEEGPEVSSGPARSPGRMIKHYSPRTPVTVIDAVSAQVALSESVAVLRPDGASLPADPAGYAALLYARLHELDERGFDRILIEMPPDTPEWAAVRDRITRAAGLPWSV
jgi:L-threonylcarbamoyladenylate synthase